jgi:hypothetical protein
LAVKARLFEREIDVYCFVLGEIFSSWEILTSGGNGIDLKLLLYKRIKHIQWVRMNDSTSSSVNILLYRDLSAHVKRVSQNLRIEVVRRKLVGTI